MSEPVFSLDSYTNTGCPIGMNHRWGGINVHNSRLTICLLMSYLGLLNDADWQ